MSPEILQRVVEVVVLIITGGVSWYWSKKQTKQEHEKSQSEGEQIQIANIKELMQLQREEYNEMLKLKDQKYDEIISLVSSLREEIVKLKEDLKDYTDLVDSSKFKAHSCRNIRSGQTCPVLEE